MIRRMFQELLKDSNVN